MEAIRKVLLLSAALLVFSTAYADGEGMVGAASPPQSPTNRVAPHINYLGDYPGVNYFNITGKQTSRDAAVPDETTESRIKSTMAPTDNPPTGLHWVTESQRPALELPLSSQGSIRFHPARHGGSFAAAWGF